MDKSKALVILSGGQDSTTCLYMACLQYDEVTMLTFDYGQRHKAELSAAVVIANMARREYPSIVGEHKLVRVPKLEGASPLTNHTQKVEQYADVASLPGGIEKTFVPMRNGLFLTLAANVAAARGIRNIVIGVSQEDFGGYPDCREHFINQAAEYINAALDDDDNYICIDAPLMNMTKAASVEKAAEALPGCMQALAFSHTCYNGAFPPCGKCHACLLRAAAFEEVGVTDPLADRARLWAEMTEGERQRTVSVLELTFESLGHSGEVIVTPF